MSVKIVDGATLSKLIATIGKTKARLDSQIQTAAMSCIAQSILHRNVSPANDLYNVLEKSMRRDSLLKMFEQYGHMAWSKVEGRILFDKLRADSDKALVWSEGYAKTLPMWYEAKKEKPASSMYDFEEAFVKFLDAALKKARDTTVEFKGRDLLDNAIMKKAEFVSAKALASATADNTLTKD